MIVRYPTRADWLRLLAAHAAWEAPAGLIFIGTIADVLQLAEECKKGRACIDFATFLRQWDALMKGPLVPDGTLQVLELDLESLRDAMFDGDFDGGESGVRFWSEVADADTPPWHTLRRLVLRPLEHRWFGDAPTGRWKRRPGRGQTKVADIVLDTDALADFLGQSFGPADRGHGPFTKGEWLSGRAAGLINRVIAAYRSNAPVSSHVIASTFAFLEIVRKYGTLLANRAQPYQLHAFLADPPEWFLVTAVDTTLLPFYCQLPADVQMKDGSTKHIEWTDAIHAATALSRNEPNQPPCYLATRDSRIVRIELVAQACV